MAAPSPRSGRGNISWEVDEKEKLLSVALVLLMTVSMMLAEETLSESRILKKQIFILMAMQHIV